MHGGGEDAARQRANRSEQHRECSDFFLGRDNVSLSARENPQAYFQKFASRPKP